MTAATTASPATGGSIIAVGDFSQYVIVDRIGMQVEVVQHLFGTVANYPIGARGVYAWWRNSARVTAVTAFKTLKVR